MFMTYSLGIVSVIWIVVSKISLDNYLLLVGGISLNESGEISVGGMKIFSCKHSLAGPAGLPLCYDSKFRLNKISLVEGI